MKISIIGPCLFAAGLGLVLLSSGCAPDTPEEIAAKTKALDLPAGCTFHFAGKYDYDPIYVVTCDGRPTTTTSTSWRSGKQTDHDAIVQVDL